MLDGPCKVHHGKQAENECLDEFLENVATAYKEKTGLQAEFYLPEINDGVKKLI